MPRRCTICDHPEREAIDQALVNNVSYRLIASQNNVSYKAIERHKKSHIPKLLAKAQEIQSSQATIIAEAMKEKEAIETSKADNLLQQVKELIIKTDGIYDRAEKAGDLRAALGAIRESRGNLELLGKLIGELQDGVTVNIYNNPEWIKLRALILTSMEPYPEAKEALVNALRNC